jgi:hypothetical protein
MTDQPTPPDRELIDRYEAAECRHAVTGVTPLSYDGPKNLIHIKNQIHNVCRAVQSRLSKPAADDLRARLDQTAQRIRGIQRPASWCVLTDGSTIESLLLPERFAERLVEGRRYYVRPLIQAAIAHEAFLLLALSQGDVRLYRMRGEQMDEVRLDGLPGSLTDVVGHEVEQQALQHHTAGGAIFHAQGKGRDDRGPEIERFVQAVDRALNDDLTLRDEPLMVAAVDKLDALFRQHTQHRPVLDAPVRLSPDQTSIEDLRTAALEAIASWRHAEAEKFVESLREDVHHTAVDIDDIVRAAIEGRVDTLVVAGDEPLWGRFDPATWAVERHDRRVDASEDLIDTAMRAAWRQGGRIRLADPAQLGSATGPLMARLRF